MTHGGRPAVAGRAGPSVPAQATPSRCPGCLGVRWEKACGALQGGRAARLGSNVATEGVWPRTWPPGHILRPAAPRAAGPGWAVLGSWPRLVGAPSVKPGSLAAPRRGPTDTTSQMWLPARALSSSASQMRTQAERALVPVCVAGWGERLSPGRLLSEPGPRAGHPAAEAASVQPWPSPWCPSLFGADRLVSGKHTDVGAARPQSVRCAALSISEPVPSQAGRPPPSDYPLPLRPRWGDRSEEAPSWLRLAPR